MNMFKQNKKLALLAVMLVFVLTTVLMAGAMVSAFAAGVGSNYTLTINFQNQADDVAFNGDSFKEIRYEIRPTGNPNDGIHGDPVSYKKGEITPNALTGVASIQINVPKEYYVFLYVVPSLGYSSSDMVEIDPTVGDRPPSESFLVADGDESFIADTQGYPGMKYEIFVDSDMEYTNVISAKTTQIIFDRTENHQSYTFDDFDGDGIKDNLDEDDDNDGIPDSSDENNRSLSITYQKNDVILPMPVIGNGEAYEFDKWMIVKADGSTEELADRTLTKGTMLLEMHTTGEVHVRPVFKKRSYDVQKIDVVFDKDRAFYNYISEKTVDYNGDGSGDWSSENKLIEYETFVNAMTNPNTFFDFSAERWGYVLFTPDLIGYAGIDATTYESILATYSTRVVKTTDNIVLRYYLPLTYRVTVYDGVTQDPINEFDHVFNTASQISDPNARVGYRFAGWNVKVNGNFLVDDATGDFIVIWGSLRSNFKQIALGNETNTVELVACWDPLEYTVKYDDQYSNFADVVHIFDRETALLEPDRTGYTFTGWDVYVETAEGRVKVDEKKFKLDACIEAYAQGNDSCLYLVSTWEAKTYSVTFDANVGNTGDSVNNLHTDPFTATFDQTIADSLVINAPTRAGYQFMGYYTNADGSGICYFAPDVNDATKCMGTNVAWTTDGAYNAVTLYAVWEALPYDVTFTFNEDYVDLIESIVVTVNGRNETYDLVSRTPISVPYRAQFTIIVTAKNGKIVEWNLTAIDHTSRYLFKTEDETYTWPYNQNFSFAVYPVVNVNGDSFKIDYETETLKPATGTSFAPGRYTIKDYTNNVWMELTVDENGKMFVNGDEIDAIRLEERFLGKSLRIIARGHDGVDADSDLIVINVAARPNPPTLNLDIPLSQDKIEILNHSPLYQYAISLESNATQDSLVWQDAPLFVTLADGTPITPGTTYWIFVRVKHTDSAPHSEPQSPRRVDTMFTGYVTDTKNALDALVQDGDGTFVQSVIDNAKAEIDRVVDNKPETFYIEIERIVEIAISEIPLAREKDKALGALREEQKNLLASGSYDANGQATMEQILNQAEQDIAYATDSEQIRVIRTEIKELLREVKITIVLVKDPSKQQDFRVENTEGMSSETSITLERLSEQKLKEIAEKFDLAIRNGKVVSLKPTVSSAAMLNALETQNVMAGYHIGGSFEKTATGVYKIQLLLPADLRTVKSIRVAYYNDETGTVEVLDAVVDGQYLKFTATRLADFVIFGDPTVELIAPIAILGGTLLLQLIAIAYLIARRRKVAKTVRLNSFALPIMALTIRFAPTFGLPIVLLLGALVIIAQIVLVALLLSSDIIRRRPNDQLTPEEMMARDEEVVPVAPLYEEDVAPSEEQVDEELSDEIIVDEEYAYTLEDEDALEATESEIDPFAIYDENAPIEEDPMDFIEPAANPNYSLPDEEETVFAEEDAAEEVETLEEPVAEEEGYALDEEAVEETEDDLAEQPTEEAFADQAWETEEIVEEDFAAIDPETELFYNEELPETPLEIDEADEDVPIEELLASEEDAPEFSLDEEPVAESYEEEFALPEESLEEIPVEAETFELEQTEEDADAEVEAEEPAADEAEEESTEETEELFYSEDDVPDIDDSYLAQSASAEDEIPDIDDSKQFE